MENRNEPSVGFLTDERSASNGYHIDYFSGLTKREYAAIQILSSLMSDLRRLEEDGPTSADDLVRMSVNAADALFDHLEKGGKES